MNIDTKPYINFYKNKKHIDKISPNMYYCIKHIGLVGLNN